MALADRYFKEELNDILTKGFNDKNYPVRPVWINEDGSTTPAHTIKTFCRINRYNLQEEFPALTLRNAPFKYAVKEMLWIFQKKSNDVRELGSKNWDSWTLKDPITGEDTHKIGLTYGGAAAEKFEYPEGFMDQVDNVLWTLKNRPMDRRMIIQLFRPEYIKKSGLPPCLCSYFIDRTDKYLNMTVVMRSADMLSAAGAGEADEMGMAILQHMLARHAGLIANELVVIKNNFHAYDRHIPILKKIVQNTEYPAPVFWLNPDKTDFYSFTVDDFKLIDYRNTKLEEKIPVAV